jgi:hypothetical protein
MQHEPNPTELDDALAQNTILHLMADEPHRWPWSVDELCLAHGDHIKTADAIAHLHATGLIHLSEGFVWPTVAATSAIRIEDRV